MKKLLLLAFGVATLASCTEVQKPGTATGTVIDASMNNVMIVTAKNDTISFSTMALRDSNKMVSVFINDTIKVDYTPLAESRPNYYDATKVEVLGRTEFLLLCGDGSWVMPNPISPDDVQGFTLNSDNTASSINMHTLLVEKWANPTPGELVLTVKSIGNKVETTSEETYTIDKLTFDELVLSQNGNVIWSLTHPKQ